MTRSRWRAAADRIVAETLAALPADATDKQKRKALKDAYPWGERRMHPYRMWCQAVGAALGVERGKAPSIPMPAPARTNLDSVLEGLLLALEQIPSDALLPLAIADRLEEIGRNASATAVRRIAEGLPAVEDVARRLWPGCHVVHVGWRGDSRREIHSSHGKRLGLHRDLQEQILGRTLVVDPAVAQAVIIEKAAAVLRLFHREEAKNA